MRIYDEQQKDELLLVICNQCKKEILVENGIIKEGCFHADTSFSYFSQKDGEHHSFDLCEACYDKMIAKFAIPVEKEEIKEYV